MYSDGVRGEKFRVIEGEEHEAQRCSDGCQTPSSIPDARC